MECYANVKKAETGGDKYVCYCSNAITFIVALAVGMSIYVCDYAACPNVTGSYRICRPTGKCIFPSQVCDSVQDCPDDSDEINCSQ